MLKTILLLIIFFFTQGAVYAQGVNDDIQAALDRLAQGTELLEEQKPQSTQVLHEASAMLEGVIEQHHIQTPGLYHALGNSYMLGGDLGHAVLAYRRGEQLDPTNTQLSDSLDHARSMVALSVPPDTSNRIWSALLSWRGYIPRMFLWVSFLSLSGFGWLACSARLIGLAPRSVRIIGVWMILGSLIPIGMLGAEWAHYQGSSDGVIVGTKVLAMSGPDDQIYDPVFTDGLQSGIEVRVIETRDSWSKVNLADGSMCWVPMANVESINQ